MNQRNEKIAVSDSGAYQENKSRDRAGKLTFSGGKYMERVLPILFNTDMVRAILDGRKTVTRRVIDIDVSNQFDVEHDGKTVLAYIDQETGDSYAPTKICRYQPGDTMYVRETWYKGLNRILYKANYSENEKFYENGKEIQIKWHPSIHMPKEAARIWLKVKDVRVERLQNMCLDDFLAEGVDVPNEAFNDPKNAYGFAKFRYSGIWTSTIKMEDNDRYGWKANPWVWVIEFERCEKPENM